MRHNEHRCSADEQTNGIGSEVKVELELAPSPEQAAQSALRPEDVVLLSGPVPTPAERRGAGRARRSVTARAAHEGWEPSPDRRDPVEVMIESNETRLQDLVPLRHRRMLASAFTFYRGSALQMALDLATCPSSGLDVQLCGDAHLANFGIFASPERRLMFDLNDFDETGPGPFEWDVKRLATSAVLACRENHFTPAVTRAATLASVRSYRQWTERYSEMTALDVWYAKLDATELLDLMQPSDRRTTQHTLNRASSKDHMRALAKLTERIDGRHRIVPAPPVITRVDEDKEVAARLPAMIAEYRSTLAHDRQALLDQYRIVDMARKVVGVGSVGTRCWILLLQGPNGGPLFFQAKEAGVAAPQAAGLPGPDIHCGERVVRGQRMLQAASDVLLGWTTAPDTGVHYYVRQLWDAKGAPDLATMTPSGLTTYAGACGWALARAHARTSDSVQIAGYLGRGSRFDEAIASFAHLYADQAERDHAALLHAADQGRIPISPAG